jgi:hypothetical protein
VNWLTPLDTLYTPGTETVDADTLFFSSSLRILRFAKSDCHFRASGGFTADSLTQMALLRMGFHQEKGRMQQKNSNARVGVFIITRGRLQAWLTSEFFLFLTRALVSYGLMFYNLNGENGTIFFKLTCTW